MLLSKKKIMAKYLIIGGSSGIGLEVSRMLSEQGHEVYASYRNNDIDLNISASQHWEAGKGQELNIIPESLDGLVYCPGTINLKPFHRIKLEDFQEELNTNYLGAIEATQQALAALKKGDSPSIVFFSTVAVQNGMPFHSSIAGAKGAIEGLTKALAAELAPKIRVNAIAPSVTDTPLASKLLSSDDKKEASASRHPLKKVGESADIANAVSFLLSDKSSWMTGEILHIDGGMNAIRPL